MRGSLRLLLLRRKSPNIIITAITLTPTIRPSFAISFHGPIYHHHHHYRYHHQYYYYR